MPDRRINDAQVERLLDRMRHDLTYRQQLARRLVEDEGYKPGTREFTRRYNSTMRRFQRYVTESAERRSFAKAPVGVQREVRSTARQLPYATKREEREAARE